MADKAKKSRRGAAAVDAAEVDSAVAADSRAGGRKRGLDDDAEAAGGARGRKSARNEVKEEAPAAAPGGRRLRVKLTGGGTVTRQMPAQANPAPPPAAVPHAPFHPPCPLPRGAGGAPVGVRGAAAAMGGPASMG